METDELAERLRQIHTGAWLVSYPWKGLTVYVGPFSSKAEAEAYDVPTDVCSLIPLYRPYKEPGQD